MIEKNKELYNENDILTNDIESLAQNFSHLNDQNNALSVENQRLSS